MSVFSLSYPALTIPFPAAILTNQTALLVSAPSSSKSYAMPSLPALPRKLSGGSLLLFLNTSYDLTSAFTCHDRQAV